MHWCIHGNYEATITGLCSTVGPSLSLPWIQCLFHADSSGLTLKAVCVRRMPPPPCIHCHFEGKQLV